MRKKRSASDQSPKKPVPGDIHSPSGNKGNNPGADNEPADAETAEGESSDSGEELYERMSLVVDKGQEPMRLDKFLVARIEGASRNKVQQSIEMGRTLVNGKTVQPNHKIKPGEEIVLFSDKETPGEEIIPEEMPLNIAYEDEDILIINKPVGLVVHPASGNYSGTLINGVAWYLLQQNSHLNQDELPRYGLVHRIDKNTSGLMVLAKNGKAHSSLAKQFFDHSIHRQYIALVWGDIAEDTGTIRAHVGRHKRFRKIFDAYPDGEQGKEAVTHYKVLERYGYVTLVQCELETGRTHQIRVHMQHIGHPLFNDETYGGDRIVKGTVFTKYKQFVDNCFEICPRHALHARTIGFIHPRTRQTVSFESELPDDMKQVIEKWKNYAKNRM
ncbi:MAG: RluA family pseudouridine synthase [Chitinophagaceae bacterium]|nr:RluA family pseudouridine synthase [Chitinophagaceae bacterium]